MTAYQSHSMAFPGSAEVDKDGDLHVVRVDESGHGDDAYICLSPEDKIALAADLIRSAQEDLSPAPVTIGEDKP